eukprot:7122365-Ditylum_brightwellii.AAC.1
MEPFVPLIDMVKHSDVVINEHHKLGNFILKMDGNAAITNASLIEDAMARSNEAYLAYAFLSGANRKKYEEEGEDSYDLISKDEEKPSHKETTTAVTVGNDSSIFEGDNWGSNEGLTDIMFCINGDHAHSMDHILHQAGGIINKNWVLLDSQSTVNVFCNTKLLANIRKTNRSLEIYINGRTSSTGLIGDLTGFKTVWFQPDGIANILSLAIVQEGHHVLHDSQHGNSLMGKRKDVTVIKFKQLEQGLYCSVMGD